MVFFTAVSISLLAPLSMGVMIMVVKMKVIVDDNDGGDCCG